MSDSPDEWGESRRGSRAGGSSGTLYSEPGGFGTLVAGASAGMAAPMGAGLGLGSLSSSSLGGQVNGSAYPSHAPAPVAPPLPAPVAPAAVAPPGPSASPHQRGNLEELRPYLFIKSWHFIHHLASSLKLGKVATHTALVFFHRFFQHQSFEDHDRLLMGAACVYLAAKVEERSNVKLSHIVLQYLIFNGHLRQGMTFADYQADAKKDPPGYVAGQVNAWKNRIIVCERTLLYTINFNLNVDKPFKALADLMRTLRDAIGTSQTFDHRTFFSQACKFLNDSMMLPEMAEVEASYAAAMALYMTALLYEVQLPGHRSWADVLQIQNEDRFHQDCLQALDLYNERHWQALKLQYTPPEDVPQQPEIGDLQSWMMNRR